MESTNQNNTTEPSLLQSRLLSVVFTRELFIECIEAIQKQYEHDKKCSDAFQVILPNDYISSYQNHWIQNQLVKLMQVAMNDEHKNSWIEYYMWELDFGKNYKAGSTTRKDGSNIDLSTHESLWDFLNNG